MEKSQIAAMKDSLNEELSILTKRCRIIESLLKNLDDYDQPPANLLPHTSQSASEARGASNLIKTEGVTAIQRACDALKTMPEPFALAQLREFIKKDGLAEIGRGNWGVIVQKLKKKRMIVCIEGEEGKPGALYQRGLVQNSEGASPAEELVKL